MSNVLELKTDLILDQDQEGIYIYLTWISFQFSLNKVIRKWAKLFNSADGHILAINFLPLVIKFVVNLHKRNKYQFLLFFYL